MNDASSLRLTGLFLGGFFFLMFLGYLMLSLSEGKRRPGAVSSARNVTLTMPGIQRLAGLTSLALGGVAVVTWFYLMSKGWNSFRAQAAPLSLHVVSELGSGVLLVIGGLAMLRNWPRAPALFMLANGFLLFTAVYAILSHGMSGHPMFMNGATLILTLASVYMVGLVYGWEHFVIRQQATREPGAPEAPEKKKAA